MTAAIEWQVLWPALLAGVVVLATHVPLGQEVLKRASCSSTWRSPRWRCSA